MNMKLFVAALNLLMLASVGCFKPAATSSETKPVATETTAPQDDATPRETIGKTTQNVLDLQKALADGGKLAETSVAPSDPLTQSAAVYRTQVGKLASMSVEQAIQLRNAQSIQDPKPLTYDQLMKEVIRAGQPTGFSCPCCPTTKNTLGMLSNKSWL